jgi:hypothetical protein
MYEMHPIQKRIQNKLERTKLEKRVRRMILIT